MLQIQVSTVTRNAKSGPGLKSDAKDVRVSPTLSYMDCDTRAPGSLSFLHFSNCWERSDSLDMYATSLTSSGSSSDMQRFAKTATEGCDGHH